MENYVQAVDLLKEALFDVEFTTDKARTIMSQLLNSIPRAKLSASKMNNALFDNIYFTNQTNIHVASVLRQQKFLEQVKTFKNRFSQMFFTKNIVSRSLIR